MCMLTYFPADVQPDKEALLNGVYHNDDGHGYAIVVPAYGSAKARMIVRHSMNGEALVEQFAAERKRFPYGPALFHSRWGTGGLVGTYNCHPFQIGGDARTVVAHNGVLPLNMQPDKNDLRCDTRMAAEEIFHMAYGHLAKEKSQHQLGHAIGKTNKLVILTIDPSYPDHSIIINESSGIWETDGIWYSNWDYLGRTSSVTPASYGIWSWSSGGDEGWPPSSVDPATGEIIYDYGVDCPVCNSKDSVDPREQICIMCKSCLDCFEDIDDCLCYWQYSSTKEYEKYESFPTSSNLAQ